MGFSNLERQTGCRRCLQGCWYQAETISESPSDGNPMPNSKHTPVLSPYDWDKADPALGSGGNLTFRPLAPWKLCFWLPGEEEPEFYLRCLL